MRIVDIFAALALAFLVSAAAAETTGIISEPIPIDERLACMGLDAYKPEFDDRTAVELLTRYSACFAATKGCERPNYNAKRNVLEAETRAYVACMERHGRTALAPVPAMGSRTPPAAGAPNRYALPSQSPIKGPPRVFVPTCAAPDDWQREREGALKAAQDYAHCLRNALDEVQNELLRRGL